MKKYELKTLYDTRKSFYGKASVLESEGIMKLYSYDTHVATINDGQLTYLTDDETHYTNTTLRHVKEFLQQEGYPKVTKKDLIKASEYLQRHDYVSNFNNL